MTLAKPAFGSPCNGCGLCCMANLCPLGQALFGGEEGPCPALEERDDGSYACGLIAHPATFAPARARSVGKHRMSEAAKLLNGAGSGCDAHLAGEADDPAFRARLKAKADGERPLIKRAKAAWGVLKD